MADEIKDLTDLTPADADPAAAKEADDAAKSPEVEITPADVAGVTDEHTEKATPPLSEDLPVAPSGDSDVHGADDEGASHDPTLDGPKPVDTIAPVAALEPEEDPASAGVDTGSDAPLPETAPEAPVADAKPVEEAKPADEFVAPYEGVHAVAGPLVVALGDEITGDLKDAGNALFKVVEKINAADLEEVQGDAYWILSNFRNQSAGVLAAVESIFKRIR